MLEIENTLVSTAVLEALFICDIAACQGACCVEGDAGAPLEEDELDVLNEIYPKLEPFLREEGKAAIESQGKYLKDEEGDWVTPLVNNRECAYAIFDECGVASCGIEKAYEAGEVDFRKPISCHLYPVRLSKVGEYIALNYHQWNLCSSACKKGEDESLSLVDFAKTALVRKFGEQWYEQLVYYQKNKED